MTDIVGIPVFGDPDKPRKVRNMIGTAEVHDDGSVVIAIQPGEITKNPDLLVKQQILGFFVSFEYRKAEPGTLRELK